MGLLTQIRATRVQVAIFFGLNAVRALSIVFMLLVFVSCVLVLNMDVRAYNHFMNEGTTNVDMTNCDYIENSTVPNQAAGIFWAVVNRVLIILEIVALILSEVGWPMRFFDVYFPVLGSDFGLGPLGIFQALISATILSHHVDDFTLVAAFLLFSISCVNMFLGLIFRGKARVKRALFSWEKEGPQSPKLKGFELANPPVFKKPRDSFVARVFRRGPAADADDDVEHRGNGFTTEGEKAAMRAAAWLSRPTQARPKYAAAPQPERSDSTMSGTTRSGTPVPEFKSSKTAI